MSLHYIYNLQTFCFTPAPSADAPVQENGEANGEVKEPADPLVPKKCDVIVLSGRKERCEAAVEALKVRLPSEISFYACSSSCLFVLGAFCQML